MKRHRGVKKAIRTLTHVARCLRPLLRFAPLVPLFFLVGLAVFLVAYIPHHTVADLQPRGPIATKQRNLFVFGALLSTVVVVPVFIMLFGFAWRYREGGHRRTVYSPELSGNRKAEIVWWLIPSALITLMSVIAWNSSHALDPYRPIASTQTPLHVQVVSLDWKWLFIYPDQHVASVNRLYIPVGRPVAFDLTSDAPMNSFWVPQLGGQIYTMPGMSTKLSLMADKAGSYTGQSANISGRGFAGMTFQAVATTPTDFATWVHSAQMSKLQLSQAAYDQLAQPSENVPQTTYSSVEQGLYDNVLMKYMMPMPNDTASSKTDMMNMSEMNMNTNRGM